MKHLFVRGTSLLVATLAIVIGLVGKVHPEWFFKIPRYGFILWAMTGHRMPPYFDERCWLKEHWSGRKGDVVISSGAKSGTLWLHNIVFLLRSGGWDDFDRMSNVYGNCEVLKYPEQPLETRLAEDAEKRDMAKEQGFHGFQFFTHFSPFNNTSSPQLYGVFPEANPDIKYIVIARNGREVLKSFFHFINSATEEVKRLYGGFPPALQSAHDTVKFVCDDVPRFYFGHLKAWWERRDLPNVLLLHYRNLRQNPSHVIRQIASFLEIPLTEELLEIIWRKSSLEYMSNHSKKYMLLLGYPGNEFHHVRQHIRTGELLFQSQSDNFLSDDLAKKWEEAVLKHFGHDEALLKFANDGVVPPGMETS